MKLLDSLLDAIVRLEGDALVMHVGEKPYVVTASASMNAYRGPLAWGQVELSSRVLTFDAVTSMLAQILPEDQQQALDEYGAIEHEIPSPPNLAQRFTVIAARGGEDVWVEVRRKPEDAAVAVAAPAVEEPAVLASVEPVAEPVDLPAQHAQHAQHVEHVEHVQPPVEQVAEEPVVLQEPALASSDDSFEPETITLDPETLEDMVVDLPSDLTSEVPLNAVPEHAIELIEEEPQGVPTEAEVDAMLAATAAQLLTSGLSSDAVLDEEITPIETIIPIDDGIHVRYGAEEAFGTVVRVDATPPSYAAEAAFELSPPPTSLTMLASIAVLESEEYDVAVPEFSYERPIGTPLFSEEAVLAAAAAPAEDPVIEQALGRIDLSVEFEPEPAIADEPPALDLTGDVATLSADEPPSAEPGAVAEVPAPVFAPDAHGPAPVADVSEQLAVWSTAMNEWSAPAPVVAEQPSEQLSEQVSEPPVATTAPSVTEHVDPEPAPRSSVPPVAEIPMEASQAPYQTPFEPEEESRPSVVVPIARPQTTLEPAASAFTPDEDAALMHTLRAAASRGAATVYVVAQAKPMIRVDGEISTLDTEPILTAADVDRLVTELAPPRKREALQIGPIEWLCEIPDVGRVRCLTFKDHRGPGVLFHMFPQRAVAGDRINLAPELQALVQQSDGLVLIAGTRASGKSTLLNAFVDLINHTRSDHVITIESQIGFVHDSRKSFVSQRETRGDADLAATFVRTALREDPDVMVIDDLKSSDTVLAALEAAESGRLVLASVTAPSTTVAVERLLEIVPEDARAKARATLANTLRGAVAQLLLRRARGGRIAAREILLNTPAVSGMVAEGRTLELSAALDGGRHQGMVPLTESLAAQVREGTVHAAEAYRRAIDRSALLDVLRRDGIDTSFAELLA